MNHASPFQFEVFSNDYISWSILKFAARIFFIVVSDILFCRITHWVEKISSTHINTWLWMLDDILAYLDVKRRADVPEYAVVFAPLYTPVAAHIFLLKPLSSSTVNCVWNSTKAYFITYTTHLPSVVLSKALALIQFASALQSCLQLLRLSWSVLRFWIVVLGLGWIWTGKWSFAVHTSSVFKANET